MSISPFFTSLPILQISAAEKAVGSCPGTSLCSAPEDGCSDQQIHHLENSRRQPWQVPFCGCGCEGYDGYMARIGQIYIYIPNGQNVQRTIMNQFVVVSPTPNNIKLWGFISRILTKRSKSIVASRDLCQTVSTKKWQSTEISRPQA